MKPTPTFMIPICAVAIAVALGGLAVGFGNPVAAWHPSERHQVEAPEGVLPAVPYAQMNGKARGPNSIYTSDLRTLVSVPPKTTDPVIQNEADKQAALAKRAARRAYAGAPPVIPHPVNANDVESCYICHGQGLVIDTIVAPKISHQRYTNCTQCHAPVAVGAPGPDEGFVVTNTFQGASGPTHGPRAYAGAPPQIPHPTHMRENCTSCHGVLGKTGMRSTHPWRANCTQCHTPSAMMDQVLFEGASAPPVWMGGM